MAELGAWPGSMVLRIAFELGARKLHPSLCGRRVGRGGRGGFGYDVDLEVPFYDERRHVRIRFFGEDLWPHVWVDGPSASPHRYDDTGELCMWFPGDGSNGTWRFGDGLIDLLDVITAHLFREAWWRETTEWLGAEVAHHSNEKEAA